MKQLLVICTLFIHWPVMAQVNLVPNPSFEEYNNCPNSISGLLDSSAAIFPSVIGWYNSNKQASGYANSCASDPLFSVPSNGVGIQEPRTGNGYLTLGTCWQLPNDSQRLSYPSTRLLTPMAKDSIYKVSFWVSLAEHSLSQTSRKNCLLAVSTLGLYFSKKKEFYPTISNIPVSAHIENNPTRFLEDTLNWMEVTELYKADGGEEYIIIGNFKLKEKTHYKIVRYGNIDSISGYGRYYLDDVSVTPYGYLQNTRTDTSLCDVYVLTKGKRSGFDSCVWNNGDTSSMRSIVHSGTYWVSSFSGNVSVTDTFVVSFTPSPVITSLKDTTVCFDQVAQILLDAGQFKSYLWKPTGETTRTIYSNTAQVYLLNVTDSNNCTTNKQVAVMETCPEFVIVPNAFTPNGDGLNDVFLPQTRNLSSYQMNIINRWGEIIFTTKKPEQGWDGKDAPADVYAVQIHYRVDGKEAQTVNANVTLMR